MQKLPPGTPGSAALSIRGVWSWATAVTVVDRHGAMNQVHRHCEPTGPAIAAKFTQAAPAMGRPDDRLREATQRPQHRALDCFAASLLAMTNLRMLFEPNLNVP